MPHYTVYLPSPTTRTTTTPFHTTYPTHTHLAWRALPGALPGADFGLIYHYLHPALPHHTLHLPWLHLTPPCGLPCHFIRGTHLPATHPHYRLPYAAPSPVPACLPPHYTAFTFWDACLTLATYRQHSAHFTPFHHSRGRRRNATTLPQCYHGCLFHPTCLLPTPCRMVGLPFWASSRTYPILRRDDGGAGLAC